MVGPVRLPDDAVCSLWTKADTRRDTGAVTLLIELVDSHHHERTREAHEATKQRISSWRPVCSCAERVDSSLRFDVSKIHRGPTPAHLRCHQEELFRSYSSCPTLTTLATSCLLDVVEFSFLCFVFFQRCNAVDLCSRQARGWGRAAMRRCTMRQK